MKFSDIPYERVTPESIAPAIQAAKEHILGAETGEEAMRAFLSYQALSDHVQTMSSLAQTRFTKDTRDPFYAGENDYYDEVSPAFEAQCQEIYKALTQSRHRVFLENKLGALLFRKIEMEMKTFSPEAAPLLQEENRLVTAYVKLRSSAMIEFDGQKRTLSQMAPYEQSTSRAIRHAACEAKAAFFQAHTEELDRLFDDLVRVRTEIAHILGFEDFVGLAYCRLGRDCYTPDDIERFRLHIVRRIVPLVCRLKERQQARLGLDKLTVYDDALLFADGNPIPKGTPEEIFSSGQRMYHELSAETAEFIDIMMQEELFDALSREGKAGGGYCTFFPERKRPFIFANFNGTSADIDVLTHEAGHALASYLSRDEPIEELRAPTLDACEIHSMSMEFFTWPWMSLFFGAEADRYRFEHLSGALSFLPYGAMVDDFQHYVYENPSLTPTARKSYWLKLEQIYRPYISNGDVAFYQTGGRWQMQAHIYEVPFYYIDYCLAQTTALIFWSAMQEDREEAWRRYLSLVRQGGRKTFNELIGEAGIPLPFEGDVLEKVARQAADWLLTKEKQLPQTALSV